MAPACRISMSLAIVRARPQQRDQRGYAANLADQVPAFCMFHRNIAQCGCSTSLGKVCAGPQQRDQLGYAAGLAYQVLAHAIVVCDTD
eukprot:jgi/Chlat1/4519/Chrsp29S04585